MDRLIHDGLLVYDPNVEAALKGEVIDLSFRTVQRRFLQATGLSHSTMHQIERARYATCLLKQGIPIIDVTHKAGYFDQSYMTRSLKHLIGLTPAQILDQKGPERLSFLYKTKPFTQDTIGPMQELAKLLSPHFTVYTYDRRGRGESGDTQPYAVEREVEDIDALIQEAGGSAFVYGISSGGCLALEAAARLGDRIRKLAIYEAPYNSDSAARREWEGYRQQLSEALATDRRGDAVVLFMKLVGTPSEMIEGMRNSPMWPMFEAVAPTLAYDAAAIGEDRSVAVKRAEEVVSPSLVMNGTVIPFMLETATTLAKAIPHARHRTLEGQPHDVDLKVLAPVLIEFFS